MVKINSEFITLSQLFKLENLASSGGEAKHLIEKSNILINGIKDNRRGRKLFPGDVVEIKGKKYTIE